MIFLLLTLSVGLKLDEGTMDGYLGLFEMYAYMNELEDQYPNLVTIIDYGFTPESMPLKGFLISNGKGSEKTSIIFSAGQSGGTPISSSAVLYIANSILSANSSSEIQILLKTRDLYFFPLINPDAYFFTESYFYIDYGFVEHLKNKRNTRCPNKHDNGVRLNRNWDFMWNTSGEASNGCSMNFAGNQAFSEVELYKLIGLFEDIVISAWVHYEDVGNQYIIPFSFSQNKLELSDGLSYVYEEIKNLVNGQFAFGTLFELTGETEDGTLIDWNAVRGTISFEISIGKTLPEQGSIISEIEKHYPIALEIIKLAGIYIELDKFSSDIHYCTNNCDLISSDFEASFNFIIYNYGENDSRDLKLVFELEINDPKNILLTLSECKAIYTNFITNTKTKNVIKINSVNNIYQINDFVLYKHSLLNLTFFISGVNKQKNKEVQIQSRLTVLNGEDETSLISVQNSANHEKLKEYYFNFGYEILIGVGVIIFSGILIVYACIKKRENVKLVKMQSIPSMRSQFESLPSEPNEMSDMSPVRNSAESDLSNLRGLREEPSQLSAPSRGPENEIIRVYNSISDLGK